MKLFAYLNIERRLVAWEAAIGRIISTCHERKDNFGVSLWQYNLLKRYANYGMSRRFINELKLEQTRQRQFPEKVSRLQGLYFFEDCESASAAVERWGFPERRRFISEIDFTPSNISRMDSEWITNCLNSEDDSWMPSYWEGKAYGIRPLTEVIASGEGMVIDAGVREAAYKKILTEQPETSALLAMAACAFQLKGIKSIARSMPAILLEGDELVGNTYIYMDDLKSKESEIIEAVDMARKLNMFPPIIRPREPHAFFNLPDDRDMTFRLRSSEAVEVFARVHE